MKKIKKQFWVNEKQAELLRQESKKTGLTEAGLLRLLIEGYSPKEKQGLKILLLKCVSFVRK